MPVARAADDFFGPVRAAGHHEERRGHKRPERQLGDSFFRDGNCVSGILRREATKNSIFTIVLLERRSLSRGGEVFANEEYKVHRCMQEKSCVLRIIFLAASFSVFRAVQHGGVC